MLQLKHRTTFLSMSGVFQFCCPVSVPSVPSNRRCSINKEDQAGGPMNMDLTMDYTVTGSVKY